MADFASLARNLLTLEINTVEKDGMSGQKMPDGPRALVDTIAAYWDFLCQRMNDFAPAGEPLPLWLRMISLSFDWGSEPYPPPPEERPEAKAVIALFHERRGSDPSRSLHSRSWNADLFARDAPKVITLKVLDDLREAAFWMTEMRNRIITIADGRSDLLKDLRISVRAAVGDSLPGDLIRNTVRQFRPQERSVFFRIRRNCDQFKAMFPKGGVTEITPTSDGAITDSMQLVTLRKAWDIGTEIILLQTVIQIDGDVVSRFQSGLEGQEREQLQRLHASAVDISFRYWTWLIDAVGKIAGQTVSSLLGGR